MNDTAEQCPSPFHRGEQAAQQRMGVREQMERFGSRVIRDHMPEQHRQFYGQLPFVFVGHADKAGWPWASILFDEPGFIGSSDEKTLDILALPVSGDPLGDALHAGTRLGLLGIELPTRRRNRLAAHVVHTTEEGFRLGVDQAFGNCPQYIQARQLTHADPRTMPASSVNDLFELDDRARSLIARSDTFFVASSMDNGSGEANQGADVSHRGGRPGFIRVDSAGTLTIPDYLGNNHFNTFGNFIENPRAGLLFLDFENGHLLTLTGSIEILWDTPETQHFEGAQRLWKFHVDHGRWINDALPLRWAFKDYSPNSLLTGTWEDAAKRRDAEARRKQWSAYEVKKVVAESSVIKSFYLEPLGQPVPTFKPGQFLTVKVPIADRDTIRTYTVSSAPADDLIRISVKRESSADKARPDGVFSNYIHDHLKVGDIIGAKAPCGDFIFDAAEQRPAVLLAGGVGITPMVSMARHALSERLRTRFIRPMTLISSATNGQQRAFFDELNDIAKKSAGSIRCFSLLGKIDSAMAPGKDYHHTGRITAEFLQAVLPLNDYDFYLCGPSAFMQSMYDMLRRLGVSDARVFAEEFGPASLRREADTATAQFTPAASARQAIVEFAQSRHEQAWSQGDGNLLEFAEAHGLNPEFGCRSGQCGACKATLLEGEVVYRTAPSVPLEDNEVLLCCAEPAYVKGEDVARLSLSI